MSRNLSHTTARTLTRLGEQVTVRNYKRDGSADEYGDEGRVERQNSPHADVPAQVETGGGADTNRDSGATRPDSTVTVYLRAAHPATDKLAGGPSGPPRSRVIRNDGTELAVLAVLAQNNGLVECSAEVVDEKVGTL